ncbi:GM25758 [Drosophila sechellia]|uniref:GM25758 n=1 Tax=Drosophila sechellia TaxID=7238 RepID=B4HLY3_DROSE|nr:GM25758 [Drosophila sechellia]
MARDQAVALVVAKRRKAKDLQRRLLQSPHRDPQIAGFLPPGMWQTDENLKMNLHLNLHSLMKPLAAPYRSAQGSSKRNKTKHKSWLAEYQEDEECGECEEEYEEFQARVYIEE